MHNSKSDRDRTRRRPQPQRGQESQRDRDRWLDDGGQSGYRDSHDHPNPHGSQDAETNSPQPKSFRGDGPRAYVRSDERILQDIHERLTADHHVDASRIDVGISNGEVTLSGWVPKRNMKVRAEHIVAQISGVKDVANSIRVVLVGDRGG